MIHEASISFHAMLSPSSHFQATHQIRFHQSHQHRSLSWSLPPAVFSSFQVVKLFHPSWPKLSDRHRPFPIPKKKWDGVECFTKNLVFPGLVKKSGSFTKIDPLGQNPSTKNDVILGYFGLQIAGKMAVHFSWLTLIAVQLQCFVCTVCMYTYSQICFFPAIHV